MRYLRSVVDYIDSLEDGDTFRRYFSFGLKFSGVLILSVSILGGFVFLYSVRENPSLLAAILCTVVIVHFGIAGIMLYWNRANKIAALDQESHLIFAPIVGITGRLAGEISCLFFIMLGILALVFSIFMTPSSFMPFMMSSIFMSSLLESLLLGLFLCFLCFLIAIFLLVFFYIIAEYAGLIGDIATNIKRIETTLSTAETTSALHEEIPSEEAG